MLIPSVLIVDASEVDRYILKRYLRTGKITDRICEEAEEVLAGFMRLFVC